MTKKEKTSLELEADMLKLKQKLRATRENEKREAEQRLRNLKYKIGEFFIPDYVNPTEHDIRIFCLTYASRNQKIVKVINREEIKKAEPQPYKPVTQTYK